DLEALGEFHQAHRLAVALRPRHAEIVLDATFGARALLVPDDAQAHPVETSEAAHHRGIIAELAIAGERREVGDERGNIVDAMGPLRVARHLRLLPRREIAVEDLESLVGARLEALDLLADRHGVIAGMERTEFLDLGLELGHGLFKIEIAAHQASGEREVA